MYQDPKKVTTEDVYKRQVVAWKQLSDTRLCRLSDIREQLSDGALMAGPDPELLQTKARDRTIDFNPERYAAAGSRLPLHGDLNRFNILIDSSGCTFLDLSLIHI